MVSKIQHPTADSIKTLTEVLNERKKYISFYSRITADLIAQAENFVKHHGNPEKIKPLDLIKYTDSEAEALERKKTLINLYSPKDQKLPFLQLEEMRRNNGLIACPSCGELGRPRTLDHYLPKDVFPELSCLLLNLTPMCDWCQGKKLTDYITSNGKKRYIHPYFDDVNRPLFSITFTPPFATPVVDIVIKNDIPVELTFLVESHLEGVDFINRFKKYFETKHINILRIAKKYQQGVEKNLRESFIYILEMEQEKSINSWDAVLYRSILENDDLMNYLENGQLPENL